MFKRLNIVMHIKAATQLDVRVAPVIFAALADVYRPAERHLHIGDATLSVGASGEPWPGEQPSDDGMTRFDPDHAVDVIGELPSATRFHLSTDGATFHRRPGDHAPAWFGRWAPAGMGLDPIVEVRFVHDEYMY